MLYPLNKLLYRQKELFINPAHLVILCGRQLLEWLSRSHLLMFPPRCNSFLWSLGWFLIYLFLMNIIGKSDGMFLPGWGLKTGFYLSVFASLSLPVSFGLSDKVSSLIVNCLMDRHLWQRVDNDLCPTAKEELRPSVQQPMKKCILPTHWVNLEVDPAPAEPWGRSTPWQLPCWGHWVRRTA